MTDLEYRKSIDDVIYLCSCAVNGTAMEKEHVESLNLENLYKVSKKHMLAAMVGIVLKDEGISSHSFSDAIALAQRKAVVLNNDIKNVTSVLDAAGIWYMPLKGTVLKDFYPRFAMREMADCDILFDKTRDADVKDLMEGLGFETKSFRKSNDDDYYKPPVSNFEMHRSLFGDHHDKELYQYYKHVKDKLRKDPDNDYGYHFSPEDFYVFMIAHEFKHYNLGGTGLRSLLDTVAYLQKNALDMEYVAAEIDKLGITEFEQHNRELAISLFSGEKLSEQNQAMFDYIIESGVFGTTKHSVENKLRKNGDGKLKYLKRRVFGPSKGDQDRKQFERRYAIFFRCKILLPFLPLYRFFSAMKINPKRIKSEMDALRKTIETPY